LSQNEGEWARSITTCAPAMASLSPSPVTVDTASGRDSDDFVATLAQNGDGLRADQAGAAADDDDLHGSPSNFVSGNAPHKLIVAGRGV
jgi:hypothetical protein